MTDNADWFSPSRVRRLEAVLEALPPRAPGFAAANAVQLLWPTCGGPRNEIDSLIDVLARSGLAQHQSKRVYRTRQAERIVQMAAPQARQELSLTLIRRGWMHDQIRALLTVATLAANELACPLDLATQVAPQLTSLLRAWPEAVTETSVRLVGSVLVEIDSPWSLIPSVIPSSEDARLTVGKRGEAYSFQFLRRNNVENDLVLWVAADDETLGYDIESIRGDGRQRIEVKSSRETVVRFIMTPNEFRRADEYGPDYTVHFWGGINLHLDPAREYDQLVEEGYPIVFDGLAQLVSTGQLLAEPRDWLVTQANAV